jgi:hypothetical protein
MIEDLIEGISCYCDTDDQYYALDNLIRSFASVVGPRGARVMVDSDAYDTKFVPKPGTSFGEMRKLVSVRNNIENQFIKDHRKAIDRGDYGTINELNKRKDAYLKSGFVSLRNSNHMVRNKIVTDYLNSQKEIGKKLDALKHIVDDKKAVTDTKAQVAQMNNDFNKTVNKPISFVKPGLIAAGGLATLGLGAYALHRYLKNMDKRKLKDKIIKI